MTGADWIQLAIATFDAITPELHGRPQGAAVSDALLDPVVRGRVVDRLDLAALQVGNDQLQALPPPIHVQHGLGLVEDPVVFGGLGHGLKVSPGHRLEQFTIIKVSKTI